MRTIITRVALIALVMTANAFADRPDTPPPGHGMYIMALREPVAKAPNDPNKYKVKEPDVTKLGGSLKHRHYNLRVITLPAAAAKHLRDDPDVAYLQRVWMGEPLDTWNESESTDSRLKIGTHSGDTGPTWTTGTFSYDGSGNIKGMGGDVFVYDSAGRLVQATVNGTTEEYRYDSFGNRVEKTTAGTTTAVPTDSTSNRLAGEVYDEAGALRTERTAPRYVYDSLGMVAAVHDPQTRSLDKRMIYTADDERLVMMWDKVDGFDTPNQTRWTVRDFEGRVLRTFIGTSSAVLLWYSDHVYADGKLVGGEREATYGGRIAYHLDHLGSVRLMTGPTRMRYGRHDYYPFGMEQTSSTQETTNFFLITGLERPEQMKFTGHQRDFYGLATTEDTDYLDYMHARYYSPKLGRFLSVDPTWDSADLTRPQSWNRYSYVVNNPIDSVDPTGRCGEPPSFVGPIEPCGGTLEVTMTVTVPGPSDQEHYLWLASDTTMLDAPFAGDWSTLSQHPDYLWMLYREKQEQNAQPVILTGAPIIGPLRGRGEILSRLGTSRESAARLGRKAQQAEDAIGIHGVSVTAGSPTGPASQAARVEVEMTFRVHNTPTRADPLHRTVELPKPVTQQIADWFNMLFGRIP